jgi:hypothetical protein
MNVSKGSAEKRELQRVNFLSECLIESDALGGVKTGRINDLNCGGAFIDIMIGFPMGTVFGLKFRLRDVEIRVQAEVRYSMRNIGVGVRFLDLSDEARDLIENVLYDRPMRPRAVAAPPAESRMKEEAVAPAPKPAAHPRSDVVMSGNLTILSVFDVINLIQSGRLTGRLAIGAPTGTGNIYFNDGRIVDADDSTDRGMAALNGLLGATSGAFSFKRSQKPFEEKISSANNTALLLQMMVSRENEGSHPELLIN